MIGHSTPIDEIQQALIDETVALGGISIMQISPGAGRVHDDVHPADRGPGRGRGRHLHRLLVARPSPAGCRPTATCCAATSARSGRRSRAALLGAGRRLRPHHARDRPGRRDAGRAARGPSSSTWPSSTPTSPATSTTTSRSCTRLRPNGVILVDNVLFGGAVIDPEATDDSTAGHPGLQRPRHRRPAGRVRDAGHRRRPHLHPPPRPLESLGRVRSDRAQEDQHQPGIPHRGGAVGGRGQIVPRGDPPDLAVPGPAAVGAPATEAPGHRRPAAGSRRRSERLAALCR